jgi:hypothetical protein
MSEHEIHEDHGHSVAAWTAVAVLLVGSALMAVAVVVTSVTLFVIGAVVCVVGVVAGKVLGMAGYGAKDVPPVTPHTEKSSGVS